MLDLTQRHGTIHGVFVQRIAIEVTHLRACQHHPVVVGFMAVAVHQHDVTGPDQRLYDDLVAGRGAVGRKKRLLGPEGATGQFLRLFDWPVWFKQAVQPARRGRGFRKKDVRPVKRAHILNPMRPRYRLAAADRHRVKDTRGLFGIFDKCGEERRFVSRLHSAQNVQVQLHKVFLVVKDPTADPQIQSGNILDRPFGHQIGVELGADLGDHPAQFGAIVFGLELVDLLLPAGAREIPSQNSLVHFGFERQTRAHNDGLDIVVEQHRDQRVFDGFDHHRLIVERVFGAAHPADVGFQPTFLLVIHVIDDQHLEIRLGQRPRFGGQHGLVVMFVMIDAVAFQRDGATAIGPRCQRPRYAVYRKGHIVNAVVVQHPLQVFERRHAGKGPIGFDQRQGFKQRYAFGAQGVGFFRCGSAGEPACRFTQRAPSVGPQLNCRRIIVHRMHQSYSALGGRLLHPDVRHF